MADLVKPELLVYLVAIIVIWMFFYARRSRSHALNTMQLESTIRNGLTEPASLHPSINESRCLGCGACASACPEGDVLGLIHSRATLINPTHCIGHGACKTACPFDAISLVFGTEKRGVDIPAINPDFQTNVPGIYIAGELGGMGLIRNAVEQGRQAMEAISKCEAAPDPDYFDVIVIGAGPAGFSASLCAMQHKMRFLTLEQDSLGGTVSHYPRGKLVMTSPVKLPVVGKMKFNETTKEALLSFWQQAERESGLTINYEEKMETIEPVEYGYLVKTKKATYKTRSVLLAIGRRGTPRKLGVPGEDLPKVVYSLVDPEQYRNLHVLVVGGGDSALEAALSIASEPGTTVTLSYRSDAFSRAKEKNRDRIRQASDNGDINILFRSNVKEIHHDTVTLKQDENESSIHNDAVIVLAGGILPTPFLKELGIIIETKHGTE